MNPLIKLMTIILIALEISLVPSLSLNCVLIAISLLVLIFRRVRPRTLLELTLIPFIPALGSLLAQFFYGDHYFAWILFTRIYAYVGLSSILIVSTSANHLAAALEQNLHLPSKVVFGIISALQMLPQVKNQIQIIKAAANMRGIRLTFGSPRLYFKAILSAIQWSDQLAETMYTHGFVEGQPRSHYHIASITAADWIQALIILIVIQFLL